MLRVQLFLLVILCTVVAAKAQTYYQVTALSGTQAVGNRAVTVTTLNGAASIGACGNPTYKLGHISGSWFNYSFSTPVYSIKLDVAGLDGVNSSNRDTLKLNINGIPYSLSLANLSFTPVFPGTCYFNGQPTITSGILTSVTTSAMLNNFITLSVNPGIAINSVLVASGVVGNGFQYDFYFADTGMAIQQPYVDTLKCPGDSLYLAYNTFAPFNSGNVFTAQLSNASGSFASPTTIGSYTATGAGTIPCKLPQGVTAGTGYRVRIVSSNPVRTSADNDSNIHILSGPATIPIATSSGPICEGATLNLMSTNAGTGISYSWTGPGSYTSNSQNPSISNAQTSQSGDYIVTAGIGSCSRKDTVTVLVKPIPAVPTAGSNSPVCSGGNLHLNAASTTAGVSYSWTGPGGYTTTSQNPTRSNSTTAMSGTYNVTATMNGCTSAAGTTTAAVNQTPANPTAGSNSPVCAGGALNLNSSTTTPGVIVYNWTGPNSFTSNQQNPVINPATQAYAGNYTVTATLGNCTSASSGSTAVTVNSVSSIGAYPSPNDTLCQMDTKATFVAVPNNAGSSLQYQWYKNGAMISNANTVSYPATNIADGDTFQIRMIATGICSTPLELYSNKIGMTVLPPSPPPTIGISASPGTTLSPWQTVTFTATGGGNTGTSPTYQWKRNGTNIQGATSNTWSAYNLNDNDEISCVITSSAWCADPGSVESGKEKVHIKTGISNLPAAYDIIIYPNPATDALTIEGGHAGMRLAIHNMLGQQVYEGLLQGDRETINISALVPGSYMLQLTGMDGERKTIKIVKE